jgi:hypothetical protein
VAFDSKGKFLGLSAEGPLLAWGPSVQIRELRADPLSLAQMVQEWAAEPPPGLQGIIWYRLPTEADSLNWRWPTMAAVMSGRAPEPMLNARISRPRAGLVEVELTNEGDGDAVLPTTVVAQWRNARLIAGDAVQSFEFECPDAASRVCLSRPKRDLPRRLPPGGRCMIAWLRFDRDTDVSINAN